MSWTKAATFNGQTYPSQLAVARALTPLTGLSIGYLQQLIKKHNGDGDAALRWWQTHHLQPQAILFDGRTLTRKALARELAPQLGLSAAAINMRLHANGNDLEQLRRDVEQRRIIVDGATYPDRATFVRALHQRCHAHIRTVSAWVKHEGFDAALIRARSYARRWRKRAQQRKDLELPVILFGWEFRSFSAMARYYGINTSHKAAWEDHVLADKSTCLFPPITNKLAQWWQAAMLDDRNRWDAATEARMPKSRLPVNAEQMPIDDTWEINMLKVQAKGRQELEAMIETTRRAERES
jgi:hypothetical protein